MLTIKNLHATVAGTEILKGIDLEIGAGQVHAVMGPNGSGKSTLAKVIAGREDYEITDGEILFEGKDLIELDPHERAGEGVFLGFQYPVEIPGVKTTHFLKAAVNALRKYRDETPLDSVSFLKLVRGRARELGMDEKLLNRALNEGFSGGEKKRNEIFQMAILEPKLAILDEIDSGLDIDALKLVAEGVNRLRGEQRSMLVITHYQRLLDYVVPDVVHVMHRGRIVASGGPELALRLEKEGYDWVENPKAARTEEARA